MRIVLAALAALGIAGAVQAAEIELRPELRDRLADLVPVYHEGGRFAASGPLLPEDAWYATAPIIGLSGVIEDGDAARLAALASPGDGSGGPFFLVLDSPGGNFLEGVRIGEFLQTMREGNGDPALQGLVVLKGEECMSACAVAFALAALPRDAGVSVRYVEVGAKLGFHMPFVPVGQETVQTEVSRAMDLTYEIMSEYIGLISNGIAPSALVANALHYRRPEEFFLLEGGLVTRFMDFVPVASRMAGSAPVSLHGLTVEDVVNMCQYLTYSGGRDMVAAAYEFWGVEITQQFPDDMAVTDAFAQRGARRLATRGCAMEWQDGDRLGLSLYKSPLPGGPDLSNGWVAVEKGQYDKDFPPATAALLADTLGCHGGRLTTEHYPWDTSNAFLEEEKPAGYRWEGVTDPDVPLRRLDWGGASMAANVNVRQVPGGAALARLDAGTPVNVSDCSLSADGQGVWYRLSGAGVSGWASARYVVVPALRAPRWERVIRPGQFQ